MSILALNDGTFDISNNKLNVYESNVVLTQNYGINGGITEISSNMFNIINSNVNISRNNPYLGLNNNWTGKNLFNGDISFININTLINSLNTINLSSSAINISGGPVNIGAAKLASLDLSGNAAFNNSSTQISSKSLIGLSGGVVNISGGAVNINGGILNISGGQLNIGSALYMSNSSPVYLTNAGTFGLGMINSSQVYIGYGTAQGNSNVICDNVGNSSINGSGTFFCTTTGGASITKGGLAVGKNNATAGYALDVSGDAAFNNGKVGIGTTPAYTLDISGVISASNKNGNSGNGVQTFITSGNGSFGSIECTNSANTVKLPLCLQGYGGSVGIGMTNPSNTLDVSGTIKASSTIYSGNLLLQGDGTNAYIRPTNAPSTLYLGGNSTTSSLAITEHSVTTSSGKLTISDSAPWQTIGMKMDNTTVPNGGFQFSMSGSNGWGGVDGSNTYGIYSNKMGTFPFVLNGYTGRVGIGKINPKVALDVSGSIQLSNTTGNGGAGVNTFITSNNGSFGSIECFNNANINSSSKLPLILQGYGGNVGIGNGMTNPSNTLDVTGTIKASSTIYSNNLLLQGDGTNAYVRPESGGSLYIGGGNTNLVRLTNNAMIMGSAVLQVTDSSDYQTIGLQLNNTTISNSGFQFSMTGSAGWAARNTFGVYSNGLLLSGGGYGGFPFVINGDNGRVGIGTTNPPYPLSVYGYNTFNSNINYFGTANATYNQYDWGYNYQSSGQTFTESFNSIVGGSYIYYNYNNWTIRYYNWRVGIFSDQSFYTNSAFIINSDKRIKTNIVDIDDAKALSILRKIQPKTYEYIDKLKRGNDSVIGFIAQEIREIIPRAVTIIKDYIPNFYTFCHISTTNVSNVLHVTTKIDLSWNPLHDDLSGNPFIDADGNACSDASGNKQFNIKLYDQNNKEIKCKTTTIIDKRTFLIDISGIDISIDSSNDSIVTDICGNSINTKNIFFLHGQEIDDFHALDKNAIFTVVTAAVQDIDRIQQAQAGQIKSLENKNSALESAITQQQQIDSAKIESLQEQVNTLQSQITLLQSQVAALLAK